MLARIALSIQADMAVLQLDERGGNRLSYLHVAMPSGWSPEEKIGRPFDVVHMPVPHIEPINAKQDAIAKLMVNATRGAVRFAWTITDDAALNHHPKRDRSIEHPTPLSDHPAGEPLLRVERQVIWGFPKHRAALFLIRTYLYPFDGLGGGVRSSLARAVSGMTEASLRYKDMDRGLILDRLA
ncbi:MAG: heme-dependent oxidative N-demethylase subunit alpha family protein [Phycisphaeraceae bacterium]